MSNLQTFAFIHPLSNAQFSKYQTAFPNIEFLSSDDGIPDRIEQAQALAIHWKSPPIEEILNAAKNLKWIHLRSTGIDGISKGALADRGITLTNGSGNHAPNIAEHVLAMMLAFARQLPHYIRAQEQGVWTPLHAGRVFELGDQHLVILGLGAIGMELAQRAKAFGMRVTGVKRSANPATLPGVDNVVGMDDLDVVLPEADHVVLALPLTDATFKFMDARRLALLRPEARLYNVGRGQLIDQDALITLLKNSKIAGAGLDVTEPEPLPQDSELWRLQNVIITSHSAGHTPKSYERFETLVIENIDRFIAGRPLLNTVDLIAGY